MSVAVNTAVHGVFGAVFLLLFAASAEMLWGYTADRLRRLKVTVTAMAVAVVAHDIWGSYVYQFYRAEDPQSPRSLLLASDLAWMHTFGMEFKEFVGGFVPILTIAAAYAVFYYGDRLDGLPSVRKAILGVLAAAFVFAVIAFVLGVLITKYAPLGGGVLQ